MMEALQTIRNVLGSQELVNGFFFLFFGGLWIGIFFRKGIVKHLLEEAGVAMKDDNKRDIAELRAETKHDIAELRKDMEVFQTSLRKDMDMFKIAIRADMDDLRKDMNMFKIAMQADMTDLRKDMAVFQDSIRRDIAELRAETRHDIAELRDSTSRDIDGLNVSIRTLRTNDFFHTNMAILILSQEAVKSVERFERIKDMIREATPLERKGEIEAVLYPKPLADA